jgi:hypothetical protein
MTSQEIDFILKTMNVANQIKPVKEISPSEHQCDQVIDQEISSVYIHNNLSAFNNDMKYCKDGHKWW